MSFLQVRRRADAMHTALRKKSVNSGLKAVYVFKFSLFTDCWAGDFGKMRSKDGEHVAGRTMTLKMFRLFVRSREMQLLREYT
mmetsp:Transcript_15176/g.22391  ORF Transcript_15176/g.22391 Transcript_15176/m.22391 type:complete len:83 (-) Transcript_15176:1044-1292(-)